MSRLTDFFYNYLIGTFNLKKETTKFYYLSLIKEGNNEWSIHGLWPQYSKNQYPTFCKKVSFDINKLETILPELESIDFSIFVDAGNVWGVDYDSNLDNSKIRSSTGFSIDWLTPIGPLNFVIAQPITKASSDVEQSFRFDIGTTF